MVQHLFAETNFLHFFLLYQIHITSLAIHCKIVKFFLKQFANLRYVYLLPLVDGMLLFLCLAVVNLTLIDLPGLTKVAVGMSYYCMQLLWIFWLIGVPCNTNLACYSCRGATWKCSERHRGHGSIICWEGINPLLLYRFKLDNKHQQFLTESHHFWWIRYCRINIFRL